MHKSDLHCETDIQSYGEKIGQTGVQKWKSGAAFPTMTRMQKIAIDAGKPIDYFLPHKPGQVEPAVDEQWNELAMIWKVLTPTSRSYVLGAAKLQRTMQFTGDEATRDRYQKDLARLTKSQASVAESIEKGKST